MLPQFKVDLFDNQYFKITNYNVIKCIKEPFGYRPCFGNNILEIKNNNNNNNNIIHNVTWKIKINNTFSKYIYIGICGEP